MVDEKAVTVHRLFAYCARSHLSYFSLRCNYLLQIALKHFPYILISVETFAMPGYSEFRRCVNLSEFIPRTKVLDEILSNNS